MMRGLKFKKDLEKYKRNVKKWLIKNNLLKQQESRKGKRRKKRTMVWTENT